MSAATVSVAAVPSSQVTSMTTVPVRDPPDSTTAFVTSSVAGGWSFQTKSQRAVPLGGTVTVS